MTNSFTTTDPGKHRAGFVKLIGSPNVDKSTLMRQLTGEKILNTSPEARTKSPLIMGITNGDNFQIVYSALPDVLAPSKKMLKKEIGQAVDLLQESDVILCLIDCDETCYNAELVKSIKGLEIPIVLVINPINKYTEEQVAEAQTRWNNIFPKADFFAVSSLTGQNIDGLRERIITLLPECPPYFPKNDDPTRRWTRYCISELIREQIRLQYKKEIADSMEVGVGSYRKKEGKSLTQIAATIYVEWDTQKDIVFGSKGSAIMKLGTNARVAIEDFLQEPIKLELRVEALKQLRQSKLNEKNTIMESVVCCTSRKLITCYKDEKVVKSCVHWLYEPLDIELEYTEAPKVDFSEYDRVRVYWLYGKREVTIKLAEGADKLKMGKIVVNMPNGEIAEFDYISDELWVDDIDDNEADDRKTFEIDEYCKEGVEELGGWPIDNDEPDEVYDMELIDLAR